MFIYTHMGYLKTQTISALPGAKKVTFCGHMNPEACQGQIPQHVYT